MNERRYEFSVGWRVVLCVLLWVLAIHAPRLEQAARQYIDMTDRNKWNQQKKESA